MAKSTFQTFVDKWTKVAGSVQQSGLPVSQGTMDAVIQEDKAALLRGSTPLTEKNAIYSVLQASAPPGQQIFQQKPSDPGLNPINLLGAGVKDLGQIARGLNPLHLIPSLLHEIESAPQVPGDVSKALGEHSAGAMLRDLAQTPLLRMVPGVTTAAELASGHDPSGLDRVRLREHPLMALLDVLPYADLTVTKVMGHEAGFFDLVGSKVPQTVRDSWNEMWDRAGLGKHVRDLSQNYAVANRRTANQLRAWQQTMNIEVLKDLTPEDKQAIAEAAHSGDPAKIAALPLRHQQLVETAKAIDNQINRWMTAEHDMIMVKMDWGPEFYMTRGQGPQTLVANLQKRISTVEAKLSDAAARVNEGGSTRSVALANRDRVAAQRQLDRLRMDFAHKIRQIAPERWRDVIQAQAKDRLLGLFASDPIQHAAALDAVMQDDIVGGLKAAGLDPSVYQQYVKEASASWQDLAKQGFNPVARRVMDSRAIEMVSRPSISIERTPGVSTAMEKTFDFRSHINDLSVELSVPAAERIVKANSVAAMQWIQEQGWTKTRDQIVADLSSKGHPELTDPRIERGYAVEQALRREGWVYWDPNDMVPFKRPSETAIIPNGDQVMIQDYMRKPMDALSGLVGAGGGLRKFSEKGLRIFRNSVLLFSPRYYVHQMVGSIVMLMGETGPKALTYFPQVMDMLKNGTMPEEVPRGMAMIPPEDKPFHLFHGMAGKQMGGIYADAVKTRLGIEGHPIARLEDISTHFHNFVGDMTRGMAYLYGKDKGGVDMGLKMANKVLANWDRMTPVERTIIRQVVPFYGWISHIMRYILTYPVDHPLRASIVSKFAETEAKDWKLGIPQSFQQLFFLGKPDPNGNVSAINARSLNPFRDVANYLTLSGFISSLNPVASSLLESLGIQLPQGTPDLYPQLQVDPLTGRLEAKRQNIMPLLVSNFIPQSDVIASYFGWSNRLRSLGRSNPQALQAYLLNAVGFPWIPRQYSAPQLRESWLLSREKAATSDLSQALKTGDWSAARRWALVPYQGKLVDPRVLEQLVNLLESGFRRSGAPVPDPKTLLDSLPRNYVPQLLASAGLAVGP